MIQDCQWARVKPPGFGTLRRGAWYSVAFTIRRYASVAIDDTADMVVVDVARRQIAVPRDLVNIRRSKPDRFSIVFRSSDDPNPVRGTPEYLGLIYAVCPSSGTRVRVSGHFPKVLKCPECGGRFEVAWEDIC